MDKNLNRNDMQNLFSITVISLLFLNTAFGQNKLHQDLIDAFQSARISSQSQIGGIIILEDQVNIKEIKKTFNSATSRSERHRVVIEELMEKADLSQQKILGSLSGFSSSASEVKSLWIINAISAKATQGVFESLATSGDVAMIYLDYPIEGIEAIPSSTSTNATEPGIRLINAHLL